MPFQHSQGNDTELPVEKLHVFVTCGLEEDMLEKLHLYGIHPEDSHKRALPLCPRTKKQGKIFGDLDHTLH